MRQLVSSTFLSLDGVMQAPGGPAEDPEGGFRYGGWSAPLWDEDVAAFLDEFMAVPFDLLLGRRTYDIFAGFWPDAPAEAGGGPLNDATKYVASRGRPALPWADSVLLAGDVVEAVRALKQQDGPQLQVHGSGELLRTLLRHGLVDQIRVVVYPVLLGAGKRLFTDGVAPATLRLTAGRVTPGGTFLGAYEPAGPVRTGSFAAD